MIETSGSIVTTLADEVAQARAILQKSGLDAAEAAQSAVVLARSVLGWTAAAWLSRAREAAPLEFVDRLRPLVDRRARREPVAYIVGEREFYGRPFKVTRDVLIPRPETELVIEEALKIAASRPGPGPLNVLDFGTGSGCLAITLALECATARVIAIDVSQPALDVARENARRLGAEKNVEFRLASDRGEPWNRGTLGSIEPRNHGTPESRNPIPFDLIVSNPPYVAEADRSSLAPDIADFEPEIALFAGVDGLAVIRALVPLAANNLAPDGRLVMEIGAGQLRKVRALIDETPGLTFDRARSDLQSIDRVVVVRN